MDQFLRGVVTAGCVTIGMFFVRFYIRDRDRMFMYLAFCFFLLAADRLALAFAATHKVSVSLPYWARAFAYILILIGILDKNLSQRRSA